MNADLMLARLADEPDAPLDLAEVALALARDEYPDLDAEAYLSELAGMAHEAQHRLRGSLRAKVRGLGRYLFQDMGFRGNEKDYYDPRNSYLNEVLDRRMGIPIALSAVAMAVGSRAGLSIVGVGLPGHFVAKAIEGEAEVLFDPFHGGRLLAPPDCERLVAKAAGTPFVANRQSLGAVPLAHIVQRMLTNLKGVHLGSGDFVRAVRVMERLRQLCPLDVVQRRDLGAVLARIGRPGEAIDHLTAYLEAAPAGPDAESVRKVLDEARAGIARWN